MCVLKDRRKRMKVVIVNLLKLQTVRCQQLGFNRARVVQVRTNLTLINIYKKLLDVGFWESLLDNRLKL